LDADIADIVGRERAGAGFPPRLPGVKSLRGIGKTRCESVFAVARRLYAASVSVFASTNDVSRISGSQAPGLAVVPFRRSHRGRLLDVLLPVISTMYPGASSWLGRRLDDILDRRASCIVALDHANVVAAAIVTPKAKGVEKLSTLWVAPSARRRGLGSFLTHCVTTRWRDGGIERGYVTASLEVAPALYAVLAGHGFCKSAVVPNRYGEGRHEVVYEWVPFDATSGSQDQLTA
jgi:ribosomal protein S18 acetylase RimI-like enzyme